MRVFSIRILLRYFSPGSVSLYILFPLLMCPSMSFCRSNEYRTEQTMPELGSMWNFLWRYLITSCLLTGWPFSMCFRIIVSMKFWIIRRLIAYAVLDPKVKTVSKCIND